MMRLGDGFVEAFALGSGNLELQSSRLARTVGSGKSAGAPGGSAVDFFNVCEFAFSFMLAYFDWLLCRNLDVPKTGLYPSGT